MLITEPNMKICIVGGTFDRAHGQESKVVSTLAGTFDAAGISTKVWNGGNIEVLNAHWQDHINTGEGFVQCDVLLWMPLIDNEEDKILPNIKKKFPHLTLVQSKSLLNGEYSSFQLVKRLLDSHSTLGLIISRPDTELRFSLIDPLANRWCDEVSLEEAMECLIERLQFVCGLTRAGSTQTTSRKEFTLETEFLYAVKQLGEKFTKHVMSANPNRFLGNASTRCCHGFPSARTENGNIYVSRRNVDKTIISSDEFVKVDPLLWDSTVRYEGDNKPSVDTPIQLELYRLYSNVNYIVHGHVYVDHAPFTNACIPCGYLEEVGEILEVMPDRTNSNFVINLKGHGCLIFAKDIEYLHLHNFVSRGVFEEQALA